MSNGTYSGRNIDVALQNAAKALGVDAGEIQYDVMAGQGGGFALIKVKSGGAGAPVLGQESLSGSGPSPDGGHDDAPMREAREDRGGRRDDRGGRRDDRGGRRDDRGGRRDDRGGRRDDRGGRRGAWPDVPSDGPTEIQIAVAEGVTLSETGQAALDLLIDLLTEMEYGVEGTVSESKDRVSFELNSDAYGEVFVAREMGLLRSLEYLVEKIVSDGDRRVKVSMDINGARAQADEDLGQSARDLAQRAIEEERVYKMGPLDPRGRRLVHIALREMDGVTTESEGEGVFRRICIIPD